MDIVLRDYQQVFYNKLISKLKEKRKVCAELSTGGGKSVIIAKLANDLKGRTLILTHRDGILRQNSNWLDKAGVLNSKENTVMYNSEIVIAMAQTLHSRIETYGIDYIGHFDNIIVDEVHIDIFKKIFQKYTYARLIGFTATPCLNKIITKEISGKEYCKKASLSDIFEDIVRGPSVKKLIDLGFLVQDRNIVLNLPDFDKLKESNFEPDGYTRQSIDMVYNNSASLKVLYDAYYNYCVGKKTIIFNSNNKITKKVYKQLKEKGVNAKVFYTSSKNEKNNETGKAYTRKEIVEWFRNSKDGVLINTNVFTTGFDVDDVECLIINRATKSLSLWIQMVGRGGRPTNKIFKDTFTVIDLGQNIFEHGIWSSDIDWGNHFWGETWRLKKKSDMLSTWDCMNCGAINLTEDDECINCGEKYVPMINKNDLGNKKFKEGEFKLVEDIPIPKGELIVKYCERNNKDIKEAFNISVEKIEYLFRFYKVSKDFYARKEKDFDKRVEEIFRPIYFSIIKSKLPGNRRRKYKTMLDMLNNRIKKRFNNE